MRSFVCAFVRLCVCSFVRSFVCAFVCLCVRLFVRLFLSISKIPFFSQVVGSFVRSFGRSFVCISRKFDIKKSTFLDTNVRKK